MQLHNDKLIKEWEQLRLEAYLPTPNDKWTIGWGHTSTAKKGMVITEQEAQALFDQDVAWAVDAVNSLVKVGLNQNQFDALVSFVFNIGTTNFRNSTLLRKLNNGDYEGAANEFPRWNKQKGKVLRGLVRRRAHEQELFLTEVADDGIVGDGQSAAKPESDSINTLKSMGLSKEMLGGVGLVTSGLFGALTPVNQTILIVALIAGGGFFIWNRMRARSKGER